MNEQHWLSTADPKLMLEALRVNGKANERKLRLFACACIREHHWHLLPGDTFRNAVDVREKFEDGLVGAKEITTAWEGVFWAFMGSWKTESPSTLSALHAVIETVAQDDPPPLFLECFPGWASQKERWAEWVLDSVPDDQEGNCALLRCIFGTPFQVPIGISSELLTWNNGTVKRLAEQAYADRRLPEGTLDPALLGVLADALLDAGCNDTQLLEHLRGEGPHWRGCWAIDVLTGRA